MLRRLSAAGLTRRRGSIRGLGHLALGAFSDDVFRTVSDKRRPLRFAVSAENYELAGDLREAHRWLTLGGPAGRERDPDGDDEAVEDAAGLMASRLRVRRALELPLDEYDAVVASALLVERARSS